MISYEVIVTVAPDIAGRFDDYMIDKHIADVVETGHFATATYYRDGERRRTVYEAYDQESLDEYIANDADRLRDDFAEHFPDGVSVSREKWEAVIRFDYDIGEA
jgi:hypothetical protein